MNDAPINDYASSDPRYVLADDMSKWWAASVWLLYLLALIAADLIELHP